jgi:hypothetical protein
MRNNEMKLRFLDEPVSAKLLQTALTELVVEQRKDRKLREGLERILPGLPIPQGRISRLGRSARILGKITAVGYESAMASRRIRSNPEVLLQTLLKTNMNETVTIRELLLKTSF